MIISNLSFVHSCFHVRLWAPWKQKLFFSLFPQCVAQFLANNRRSLNACLPDNLFSKEKRRSKHQSLQGMGKENTALRLVKHYRWVGRQWSNKRYSVFNYLTTTLRKLIIHPSGLPPNREVWKGFRPKKFYFSIFLENPKKHLIMLPNVEHHCIPRTIDGHYIESNEKACDKDEQVVM